MEEKFLMSVEQLRAIFMEGVSEGERRAVAFETGSPCVSDPEVEFKFLLNQLQREIDESEEVNKEE